jgi:type IV pilus assembly protein PilY1
MYWSYMPDGIKYQSQTKRAKSAVYNRIYYDPTVTYLPPTDEHGASLGDVSFTNAWNDGFDQAGTCTINLATVYRPTWYYANSGGDNCDPWERTGSTPEYAGPAEPAYYYVFDATNSSNCTVTDDSCYDQVVVSASSGPGGIDERTNFANWYSYYRKRIYITKSAAARAFSNLSGGFRLAHQTINGGGKPDRCGTLYRLCARQLLRLAVCAGCHGVHAPADRRHAGR